MPLSTESAYVPTVFRRRRWWLLLLLIWAGAAWKLSATHVADIRAQGIQVATEGARNMYRMVVLTRSWNASHGGVYVPITSRAQPNPYLDTPRRDVETNDGQHLTLINPAYMTRLIGEMAEIDMGAVFRLTSLRPIRAENAPDDWERASLKAFEVGATEMVSVESSERGPLLRYMAPLRVEKPCMNCHAKQGYVVGDIRGGISVSQKYSPIEDASRANIHQTQLNYLALFLSTTALGWTLLELLRRRWMELARNIKVLELTRGELVQSEKMASLGRMVAGFAHEVNTPVGVAVGAVSHNEETLVRMEAMLTQEEVSEVQLRAEISSLREGGALAMANLRRAANLVQSFKRTSVDQTSEQVRPFDMKELVDDVLFALHSTLKRLPIEVKVVCVEPLLLTGMPGIVQQLLTNLMMNAIQHAFDGGTRAGRIDIRLSRVGESLHLEFVDNGKGMDTANLARIFEPFYTTRRGEGGSGLGLYICYNIVVSQLGGTIRCDSQPEAGCRFVVEFPMTLTRQPEKVSP